MERVQKALISQSSIVAYAHLLHPVRACQYGWSHRKLLFVPTASATAGAHRDCLFVASFAQQPEIQCLVFRGQIVSGDLRADGRTIKILLMP